MSRQPLLMTEDGQGSTLASKVFERLREDILEGQLPPGEKLRIETLQERYQVGASPIREALNRLTSVRLVEQVERRGFRVATLSDDDLLAPDPRAATVERGGGPGVAPARGRGVGRNGRLRLSPHVALPDDGRLRPDQP